MDWRRGYGNRSLATLHRDQSPIATTTNRTRTNVTIKRSTITTRIATVRLAPALQVVVKADRVRGNGSWQELSSEFRNHAVLEQLFLGIG
jgi:hypothetical protein